MTCKPIKSFCQSKGATRMSNDAVVKSEAEHPGRILVDHTLDSISYVVKVIVARGDALPAEAHVIVHKRIGNHQLVARADLHPVWKFVIVGVTVVGVSCVEQNRSSGKRWGITRVPTFRAAPHALGNNLSGKMNVLAFRLGGEICMHLPPQPMAGDIPARFADGCRCFGIPLESTGDGKYRARDVSLGEHPMQAPDSGSAPIHEHAFGRQVAAGNGRGRPFCKRSLGNGVAVRHGILTPFLVVDHEIDGDMRAIRPARIWRLATVTQEVSRTSRLRISHLWFSHDLPQL